MQKYTFGELSLKTLKRLVKLEQKEIADYAWTEVENITITEDEKFQLNYIKNQLKNYPTHVMNEATLWSRAIYPLLRLAEQANILATSEVPLTAQYQNFELHGIADGILGKCIAGNLELPYLVVLEAKRGLEGQNPQPQVYGQLLATAYLNWEENNNIQNMFGCYIIAGAWTFVRAEVSKIDTDYPLVILEHSREYNETMEAEMILKILKSIVANYLSN
ncbi:hypothetical protein BGP_4631 [Beggiatoa sp. PS]|nr:hypothetical protein BGP_4631 [Beggiatoa sp. PS]